MKLPSRTLALAVGACLVAPAYAIEMTDYTEPTITTEEAYVEGAFSGISGNNKDSASGQLRANYDRSYESRERNMSISAEGNYSDTSHSDSVYDVRALGDINSYLAGRPNLFWFGKLEGYADSLDANSDYAEIIGGMGYGRVTTATPLARALRVVEELQQHNVISGSVSDEGYLKLAQTLARQYEYRSKYGAEEYLAEFITAVEATMQETGMISSPLNAMGATYLQQVLSEAYDIVQTRRYGWWVRGGAGVRVDENGDSTDPALSIEFTYAKPIGLKAQFTESAQYSATISGSDRTGQNFSNLMEYTYEMSDMIDWINGWRLDYNISDSDVDNDTLSNNLFSTFRYYLTNRLTLNATVAASHVDDDVADNGNDDVEFSTLLSVRYRLR